MTIDFSKLRGSKAPSTDVMPIGKYKGEPVQGVLDRDSEYCQWLAAQPWFREKYANVYNVIVNYGGDALDTPEHNQMQAAFLDDARCFALARRLRGPELFDPANVKQDALRLPVPERLRDLAVYTAYAPKIRDRTFEDAGWDVVFGASPPRGKVSISEAPVCACSCDHSKCPSDADCQDGDARYLCEHWKHPQQRDEGIRREYGQATNAHCCPDCVYADEELRGWIEYGQRVGGYKCCYRVECKPDLGDDYPGVLRQVQRYPCGHGDDRVVLVRRHRFDMVTFEQVSEIFAASEIQLVRETDLNDNGPAA